MNSSEQFDRSKIYEKLEYKPEPPGYSNKIPWIIQQQVAATNGIHFVDSIGKLDEIPIPPIPIPPAKDNQRLCLDIGCGWGRWLVAIGRKGYIPIGIDLRHEFCITSRETLKISNLDGYTIVADLNNLPFKDGILDAVWSFSVIQHTHQDRLKNCIQHIYRILRYKGFCFLEFPNKFGIRNFFGPVKTSKSKALDYNSWVVRYYSLQEYRSFFEPVFGNYKAIVHSVLGIGVLPNDLKYAVGLKNRLQIGISLLMTKIAQVLKPLVNIADSVYLICTKESNSTAESEQSIQDFLSAHRTNPTNNLNVISLLSCPVSGGSLKLNGNELVSKLGQLAYPILEGIPILIVSEARKLNVSE